MWGCVCFRKPDIRINFNCIVKRYDELKSQATVSSSGDKDLATNGSKNNNDQTLLARLSGSQVCDDMDAALVYAEVSSLVDENTSQLYPLMVIVSCP